MLTLPLIVLVVVVVILTCSADTDEFTVEAAVSSVLTAKLSTAVQAELTIVQAVLTAL